MSNRRKTLEKIILEGGGIQKSVGILEILRDEAWNSADLVWSFQPLLHLAQLVWTVYGELVPYSFFSSSYHRTFYWASVRKSKWYYHHIVNGYNMHVYVGLCICMYVRARLCVPQLYLISSAPVCPLSLLGRASYSYPAGLCPKNKGNRVPTRPDSHKQRNHVARSVSPRARAHFVGDNYTADCPFSFVVPRLL